MKRTSKHLLVQFLSVGIFKFLGLACVSFGTACTGLGEQTSDVNTGSAVVVVSALSGSDVARATVTVTASDITTPIAGDLSSSNNWRVTLGGIPAGAGRTFTLSALDVSGAERFHGATSNVTVAANQTQTVTILAQQTNSSAPFADSVPVIDLAQASSNRVAPGSTVNLAVSARDADPGDTLNYAWVASAGSFSGAAAPTTTWTAPNTEGSFPITVTVTDSSQESTAVTLSMTVTNTPVPAPIPCSFIWILATALAGAGIMPLTRLRVTAQH